MSADEINNHSDEELLESLLSPTVVRELIGQYGSLQKVLLHARPDEVTRIRGMGPVKAKQLFSICELVKRLYQATANIPTIITTPRDVYTNMLDMQHLQREEFRVVFLNTKNHIMAVETATSGTINAALVDCREVFRRGIRIGAASVILAHNHPSGDPTPSSDDLQLTKKLAEAGRYLDIPVLDHCIIGLGRYSSLKEMGMI